MAGRRRRIGPGSFLGCFALFASVGFCAASAGAGSVRHATVATAKRPASPRHTVSRGQTLSSIARMYGVCVGRLAAVNGLGDPDRVRAGARLLIPTGRTRRPSRTRVAAANRAPLPIDPAPPRGLASPGEGLPWPVDGPVISGFDRPRHGHRHNGIDIGADEGTPIRAVAAGVVTLSEEQYGAYGRLVAIEHDDGAVSYYGHNLRNLVTPGQRVEAGEAIALVGHSGNASCDHVHFEVRIGGEPVDPLAALASQPRRDPPAE